MLVDGFDGTWSWPGEETTQNGSGSIMTSPAYTNLIFRFRDDFRVLFLNAERCMGLVLVHDMYACLDTMSLSS